MTNMKQQRRKTESGLPSVVPWRIADIPIMEDNMAKQPKKYPHKQKDGWTQVTQASFEITINGIKWRVNRGYSKTKGTYCRLKRNGVFVTDFKDLRSAKDFAENPSSTIPKVKPNKPAKKSQPRKTLRPKQQASEKQMVKVSIEIEFDLEEDPQGAVESLDDIKKSVKDCLAKGDKFTMKVELPGQVVW